MLMDCPNCSAVWSMDEIDEGRCYACGYPNHEPDSEYDEDDDWDDDEFWEGGAA